MDWRRVVLGSFLVLSVATHANCQEVTLSGLVVDKQSQPVGDMEIRGFSYLGDLRSITNERGEFTVDVPEKALKQLTILAEDPAQTKIGVFRSNFHDPPNSDEPIRIRLESSQHFEVLVVDANDEPIAQCMVGAMVKNAPLIRATTDETGKATLHLPNKETVGAIYAAKQDVGFDYRTVVTARDKAYQAKWFDESKVKLQLESAEPIVVQLREGNGKPVEDCETYCWHLQKPGEPDSFNFAFAPDHYRLRSNNKGLAVFRGIPKWHQGSLTFWTDSKQFAEERIAYNAEKHPDRIVPIELDRLVTVTGRVLAPDGLPAADVRVISRGVGFMSDGHSETVETDADGNFALQLAPDSQYMLFARGFDWASPAITDLTVLPYEPVTGLELKMQLATRIYGLVAFGDQKEPIENQRMSLRLFGPSIDRKETTLRGANEAENNIGLSYTEHIHTDNNGKFEFLVGPGEYRLTGPSELRFKNAIVQNQESVELNFFTTRREHGPFTGSVVVGNPPQAPVKNARVTIEYQSFDNAERLRTDDDGQFSLQRKLKKAFLRAESDDGKLAGMARIGVDDADITIRIQPTSSAKGRLLDRDTGKPKPETEVSWHITLPRDDDETVFETKWGGRVTTDAEGKFILPDLVVDQKYEVMLPNKEAGTSQRLASVKLETPDPFDLGDVSVKKPYVRPTFEQRVERLIGVETDAVERYSTALTEAKKLRQHVLVLVVDETTELGKAWFQLRLNDRDVRQLLPHFKVLEFRPNATGLERLAKQLDFELDKRKAPYWLFLDLQETCLAKNYVPLASENNQLDKPPILEALSHHVAEPLDAQAILDEALAIAKRDNKRVLVQETATWCGPCHKLRDFLERHRAIWEKDYVWILIDERWKNSEKVMDGLQEGYRGGIPWVAILDAKGNVLMTSEGPNGNIGYPSEPESIKHFMEMMETTQQRMTPKDLESLRSAFLNSDK